MSKRSLKKSVVKKRDKASAIYVESAEVRELRLKNEALREELTAVLANALENERIWRHFAAIERVLFRTRDLERLVDELLREIRERFQTGLLVLFLSHPEALDRLFQGEPLMSRGTAPGTWISALDAQSAQSLLDPMLKPTLFAADSGYPPLLAQCGASLRSGALIPMKIGEILFGALLLGSPDPARYDPSDGADFLEQLGINISLSIDNCLTYEKVKEFAVKDQLTGFLNFFQIHTILEREFRRARRSGHPLSVLVVDLNFVQDWDESANGMEVLKHAAGLLEDILPADGCFLGRYGSDEFLIVLPGVPEEEAREVIPYISATMRKSPYREGNTATIITTAIGVGAIDDLATGAQDLVDWACSELYALKVRQGGVRGD
jgi:diguanylate cyclase (GGDEF)-like protein